MLLLQLTRLTFSLKKLPLWRSREYLLAAEMKVPLWTPSHRATDGLVSNLAHPRVNNTKHHTQLELSASSDALCSYCRSGFGALLQTVFVRSWYPCLEPFLCYCLRWMHANRESLLMWLVKTVMLMMVYTWYFHCCPIVTQNRAKTSRVTFKPHNR